MRDLDRYDITFCSHECGELDCMRNLFNIQTKEYLDGAVYYSMANLYMTEYCPLSKKAKQEEQGE